MKLEVPELGGDAAAAVAHESGHIQIIAAAGSGKTEVVSQRVAQLLANGAPGESIVAFTFTEKAADELKERIRLRATALVGEGAADMLGRIFVGTIHGYCFRLLQTHVTRYETFTPLDANQLTNLLYREHNRLDLKKLDPNERTFYAIKAFQDSVDVVENELISLDDLPDDEFKVVLVRYYEMLERYRFMSFGRQISEAVQALEDPEVHKKVTDGLRHLIVDEYQDVNPAQEQLIRRLVAPEGRADVVVVGDDDQAIYQWRGSSVSNMVDFANRYPDVTTFNLLVNRRSRPGIIELANAFAQTIPERLEKEMGVSRAASGPAVAVTIGHEDERSEANAIAQAISNLNRDGLPLSDIAILVRGRAAFPRLLEALEQHGIPVQPGGRGGLFEQPEAHLFGATFSWLSGVEWAPKRFDTGRRAFACEELVSLYQELFYLSDEQATEVGKFLVDWQIATEADATDWDPSLVADFYRLLALIGVSEWEVDDPISRNRLGTIARFTEVLADYESVTRRARMDMDNPGEQVGGAAGDKWFYRNFAILLVNHATVGYDDFDGEEDLPGGGVTLGTIHGAKGLEWPVVFLPSLTKGRFPSRRAGNTRDWLIPREMFDAQRYEGGDSEERRLFYVAVTRARDWVSLSSHAKVTSGSVKPSPYIEEAKQWASDGQPAGAITPRSIEVPDLTLTYSELDAYLTCPRSYLLRSQLGFMPRAKTEIGFGNAVHHLLREIAESARASGEMLTSEEVASMFEKDFFLPFANKPAHKEMRANGEQLVRHYLNEYPEEMTRTWATEHPFELYLPGVVINGRADVIYDEHDGVINNLAIVDYKTATGDEVNPLQLQIYADAARREGLNVGGAFVHDLGEALRHQVDIGEAAISDAEGVVAQASDRIRDRDFEPTPSKSRCANCDVRSICPANAK